MSQFRIKQIDIGIPDSWDYRINDDGLIEGNDIVAEDPNELADAISETQELILKASVYAPNTLINTASGALERIKLLEDNLGSTTLQDAYDEGRSITVTPGRPLVLGSSGAIELDSGNNLKLSPNSMKIYNGTYELNFSYNSITSQSTDVIIGTVSSAKNLLLTSSNILYLKDSFLNSNVSLSEAGITGLDTTSQSLIGAINEIAGGFTSANLQQMYDQSTPPEIVTDLASGALRITNGTGNSGTPALTVNGGINGVDFLDIESLTVGPSPTINCQIYSDGKIHSANEIKSNTKVTTPKIENLIGELTFQDIRSSVVLSDTSNNSIETSNQTLIGSINELNTIALGNATSLSILENEHNLSTGKHKIITTQSDPSGEATKRLVIKNSAGTTTASIDGYGEITATELSIGSYDLSSELLANENHRNNDGTSHSAVSTHLSSTTTHGTSSAIVGINDTQTLTNKTLTSPTANNAILNGTISGTSIKDEDDLVSNSDQHLATQSSIKAYVDTKNFISLSDTIPSFTAGRVIFEGASSLEDSDNLFWDNTNARLGINSSTPNESLDVVGNINSSGSLMISGTQVVGSQQTDITSLGAGATVETATAAYTSTEQDMLNNLKTDSEETRAKLNSILSMLRTHGLIG